MVGKYITMYLRKYMHYFPKKCVIHKGKEGTTSAMNVLGQFQFCDATWYISCTVLDRNVLRRPQIVPVA